MSMSIFDIDFRTASVSEQIMFSTVRIQTSTLSGISTGTGFIYKLTNQNGAEIPILITNKHVIHGFTEISVCFHMADDNQPKPSGKQLQKKLIVNGTSIFMHPNPEIDLCAIYLAPTILDAFKSNQRIFYVALEENILPDDTFLASLKAIEDVTMFGYPLGLWDAINNLPIMRKGATATHPMVNFQNNPITIIDLACFPGSSGSPVFIMNEGIYSEKNGPSRMGTRLKLLGILFGGPVMTAEGKIVIKDIPTQAIPASYTQLMIHLGYIVKSSALKEFFTIIKDINKDVEP